MLTFNNYCKPTVLVLSENLLEMYVSYNSDKLFLPSYKCHCLNFLKPSQKLKFEQFLFDFVQKWGYLDSGLKMRDLLRIKHG